MPIDRPEYVVAEAQEPHLFVIRRQARQRDGTLQHQAYYHILYMTIYQAPTLHSVISGRLRRCMFLMRQGLERVRVGAWAAKQGMWLLMVWWDVVWNPSCCGDPKQQVDCALFDAFVSEWWLWQCCKQALYCESQVPRILAATVGLLHVPLETHA